VQFLEEAAVQALYARSQVDPRHQQVVLGHQQTSPTRYFTDGTIAFATPAADEFYWLLDYLETRQQRLLLPPVPITEPALLTLLDASLLLMPAA